MPDNNIYVGSVNIDYYARQQVKAKFPNLPEGSSGWYRAVANRIKRLSNQY